MQSVNNDSFDSILLRAIDNALQAMFGSTTARSVNFYIDSHLAMSNPGEYERALQKMFKDRSRLIMENITKRLCEYAGVEYRNGWRSFEECVKFVKENFSPDSGRSKT